MQNKGQILPREVLIDELWQSEAFIDENTLNVNIARLRRKLAEIGLPDYLKTRRAWGIRYEAAGLSGRPHRGGRLPGRGRSCCWRGCCG